MSDALTPEPTAVAKYFFTPLYYPRSAFSVIGWWERRRLVFNLSVGAAGVLSLVTMAALSPGDSSAMQDFGWVLGVAAYGLMANACYTLGSVADLLWRRLLGVRAPDLAPVLLRYGFVFAIGLTLLPIPIAVLARIAAAIFAP